METSDVFGLEIAGVSPMDKSEHRSYDYFWAEIAPCEHLVQIYEEEDVFLEPLEAFIIGGLTRGEGVVVIVTPQHKLHIDTTLLLHGFDLEELSTSDQYICLDVEDALAKFMVNQWPDEQLFRDLVTDLLQRAHGADRRVRAFGEMVAVLWDQGLMGATVRLEHLWHQLCQEKNFSLFCAYPKSGFTDKPDNSLQEILNAHSTILS